MSRETQAADAVPEPTPECTAQLLNVVADHSVESVLADLENLMARLRADAADAGQAREVLRNAPGNVLREALRLRAARIEAGQ